MTACWRNKGVDLSWKPVFVYWRSSREYEPAFLYAFRDLLVICKRKEKKKKRRKKKTARSARDHVGGGDGPEDVEHSLLWWIPRDAVSMAIERSSYEPVGMVISVERPMEGQVGGC